jgi:hypothetical protein
MSLSLSTKGIIPEEHDKTFSLRGIENIGVIRSTQGMISAVAFADVAPGHDFEVSVNFDDVAITLYPNGLEQRIGGVTVSRRQFKLTFPVIYTSELDDLWNLYIARHGPLYPLVFNSPHDGQRYLVRFSNKTMSRTIFAYLLESTGINLIEVLGE